VAIRESVIERKRMKGNPIEEPDVSILPKLIAN
jgi:hypothetical protein